MVDTMREEPWLDLGMDDESPFEREVAWRRGVAFECNALRSMSSNFM